LKVEGGVVAGVESDGVRIFKGLPYAAPPVGDLRWRPPQPVVPWSGVRDASQYGAECPQPGYPAGSVYARPRQPQHEDCLFLNVWTTAREGDRQPVLVWLHGGNLVRGSGMTDVRDGRPMARRGIVLVSINYRLGPLGYLAHPALSAESPRGVSGNYGTLDQIAALEWVQRNIAVFGGDPAAVTMGGESAGSWSVHTLTASPLARGLFARAIAQSGGRFDRGVHLSTDGQGVPSAESAGVAFATAIGATTIDELRRLPAERLLDVEFAARETVDGWVLPDEVRAIFARGEHAPVPVLLGSTADEATAFGGSAFASKTMDEHRARTRTRYGPLADAFDAAYEVRGEHDLVRAALESWRDRVFTVQMRRWARATVAHGQRAYLYLFSHHPPHPRRAELGAFHAGELPYVFGTLDAGDPREAGFAWTAVDRRLSDAMSGYWARFIRTGDPNEPGRPEWPPYDTATEPFMEFGDEPRVGHHLYRERLDFLDHVEAMEA
jgi:para-nitrobenzyl esterase